MSRAKSRTKKGKTGPKKRTFNPLPLIQFFKKIAKQKGLKQATIAKVDPRHLPASLVNHIFRGRRHGKEDLKRIADAMKLDKMERAQMKRAWTEGEWGEPFSGGIEIEKSLDARLDDLLRHVHQVVEALREEQAIFVSKGTAGKIIKLVTEVTPPKITMTIEALVFAQGELAKAREMILKRRASLTALQPDQPKPPRMRTKLRLV